MLMDILLYLSKLLTRNQNMILQIIICFFQKVGKVKFKIIEAPKRRPFLQLHK